MSGVVVELGARRPRRRDLPAKTRADELLGHLIIAGPRGMTAREMTKIMPRSSWKGALRRLLETPGVPLTVEEYPARPPRHPRAWLRAYLHGDFIPAAEVVEDPPTPPDPQTRLFDEERAA